MRAGDLRLEPVTGEDLEAFVTLRLRALRPDLERVGVWHPDRARSRAVDAFSPQHTSWILRDERPIGSVSVRPTADGTLWLEAFYLEPAEQGAGVGSRILAEVLASHPGRTWRLNVLVGSQARALYERHGFVLERTDGVDEYLIREPAQVPGP